MTGITGHEIKESKKMNKMELARVQSQAKKELEEENFTEKVKTEKEKLIAKRNKSFWIKVFPWKITIERR